MSIYQRPPNLPPKSSEFELESPNPREENIKKLLDQLDNSLVLSETAAQIFKSFGYDGMHTWAKQLKVIHSEVQRLKEYTVSSPTSRDKWTPVRPMGFNSLRPCDLWRRIKLAYGVFIGRYDVLK